MRAIESAMLIDAQPLFHIENLKASMKKRLWWSILLRDRSLCIGLRRRPQAPVEYCEWMVEADFEDEINDSCLRSGHEAALIPGTPGAMPAGRPPVRPCVPDLCSARCSLMLLVSGRV